MPKTIHLSNCNIGTQETPFIIAEIGSNFGNYDQAVTLINFAKQAGAKAVKFQTYKAKNITTPGAIFTLEDGSKISQYDYFKHYELSEELHHQLKQYCDKQKIIFFSSPSHKTDLELLEKLQVELYKVGSDDLTNIPFLKIIGQTGKPIIISTGMSRLSAIEEAIETIFSTGNTKVIALHCIVGYPAHDYEANIRVIATLKNAFDIHIGFSDHFISSTPAILAAALGASVFEKHITLDRRVGGPDNDVAVESFEFKEYVQQILAVDKVLGKPHKHITAGEEKWHDAARKSITTLKPIKSGEQFEADNIGILRPYGGIHPRYYEQLINKKAKRDIDGNRALSWDDIIE